MRKIKHPLNSSLPSWIHQCKTLRTRLEEGIHFYTTLEQPPRSPDKTSAKLAAKGHKHAALEVRDVVFDIATAFGVPIEEPHKPILEDSYKAMLTEVLTNIDEHGLDTDRWDDREVELLDWLEEVSPRTHRFWKEHRVDSEEYIKQIRQEALLKLSDEEKRALGLRDEADNEPEEL